MKMPEDGRITIPKEFRDRFGMNEGVEIELTPTEYGLLIQKQTAPKHPVDTISGILDYMDVDQYINEIRNR